MSDENGVKAEQTRTSIAFREMLAAYAASRPKFSCISPRTLEGFERWALVGVPAGGFVMAVLRNDLFEVVARADSNNQAHLAEVCMYVYNRLPRGCFGSPEAVENWAKKGGLMCYDRKTAIAAQLQPQLPH